MWDTGKDHGGGVCSSWIVRTTQHVSDESLSWAGILLYLREHKRYTFRLLCGPGVTVIMLCEVNVARRLAGVKEPLRLVYYQLMERSVREMRHRRFYRHRDPLIEESNKAAGKEG